MQSLFIRHHTHHAGERLPHLFERGAMSSCRRSPARRYQSTIQSQLIVKDKQSDLTCSTVSELEVSNSLKRRALAFDLVGVCTYDIMASYHADLNLLPMDLALPTILSQPTVAFHLLPLSGAISDDQDIKPKDTVKKPLQAAKRKRKERTKRSQRQKSWA